MFDEDSVKLFGSKHKKRRSLVFLLTKENTSYNKTSNNTNKIGK